MLREGSGILRPVSVRAWDRLPLPLKLPAFGAYRRWGWPRLLPVNLTVSVTYTCTSRCKTCDIWQKKVAEATLAAPGRNGTTTGGEAPP